MTGKTRIAPTPSGFLHFGNAYSFVKTYLLARQQNLKILLRIDDLDRARYREKYVVGLFKTLHSLGIEYDEGPQTIGGFEKQWSQKNRLALYHNHLVKLSENKNVFACACSRRQVRQQSAEGVYGGRCIKRALPLDDRKVAWRFNTSACNLIKMNTWSGAQELFDFPEKMKYFVVRRKDKIPAYQLTSVVDDQHFNITHVVRGEDLWDSTLAQIALAENLELSFKDIKFHHHPLIHSPVGLKLSKTQKAAPVLKQLKRDKPAVFFRLSERLGFTQKYASLAEMEAAILKGEEGLL